MTDWPHLEEATAELDPPFAVLDVAALDANADDLVRRAGGVPIRLASKSVRCRWVLDRVLDRPGFAGVMAYALREALWLADLGQRDVLVAYPTVDRAALRELRTSPAAAAAISIMADSTEHLEFLRATLPPGEPVRLCIDVDASLRYGPVHLGVRRSPLRTPQQARALAADIAKDPTFRLVGLMFYDAQVAGLPDSSVIVRRMKHRSLIDLLQRRGAVVDAVREVADLELVNGGGTGSLHATGRDPCLTELAAGSGLYGPTLFDGYRDFTPTPALFFALPVSRRPARRIVTAFAGGYVASGHAGRNRLPRPTYPEGLRLVGTEGAGEVQTPVRGRATRKLALGDRIWFRHAKAGEMCERFEELRLIHEAGAVGAVGLEPCGPTYRGEGKNFG